MVEAREMLALPQGSGAQLCQGLTCQGCSMGVHTGQMTRPALLLDVDGVINPYGTATCPAGFTEYDLFPGEEPVRLCPAHGGMDHRAPARLRRRLGHGVER
jgi:hypothetical protein